MKPVSQRDRARHAPGAKLSATRSARSASRRRAAVLVASRPPFPKLPIAHNPAPVADTTYPWAWPEASKYSPPASYPRPLIPYSALPRPGPLAANGSSSGENCQSDSSQPEATFPPTRRYATELTSGTGDERLDFTFMLADRQPHQANSLRGLSFRRGAGRSSRCG